MRSRAAPNQPPPDEGPYSPARSFSPSRVRHGGDSSSEHVALSLEPSTLSEYKENQSTEALTPAPPSPLASSDQSSKMSTIRLCSVARPHMRAFHLSWVGFCAAFIAWFSFAPLMPMVKESLGLTKEDILYSNFASVSTTVITRLIAGPICDSHGPKNTLVIILLLASIPCFLAGVVVTNATSLILIRAAKGVAGASFVAVQSWIPLMFTNRVVGTANATVAGWGNLGGGLTQVLMIALYQLAIQLGAPTEEAWRYVLWIPGLMLVVIGVAIWILGEDCPKLMYLATRTRVSLPVLLPWFCLDMAQGNYTALRRQGRVHANPMHSASVALHSLPSYLLAIQYACSFGVELTVFNMAATYFHDEFYMNKSKAGNIATLCGITNIVSRTLGGLWSDLFNQRFGLRGRKIIQCLLLALEGAFLLWFARAHTHLQAVILLLCFSFFVQAANGSCFALVPYVCPEAVGSVSGFVGAGGNIGAMAFSLMFIFAPLANTAQGFVILGIVALVGSVLALLT